MRGVVAQRPATEGSEVEGVDARLHEGLGLFFDGHKVCFGIARSKVRCVARVARPNEPQGCI